MAVFSKWIANVFVFLLFSVILFFSGCSKKMPPGGSPKIGDVKIVENAFWPVCSDLKTIKKLVESKKESNGIMDPNMLSLCPSPTIGVRVRILDLKDGFYKIKIHQGMVGWTSSNLWTHGSPGAIDTR